ncbi:uncharacterized protein LOC130077747 [Rhinichthys klamathensis goyatoka]|uniref:uncharacterized protein LOC130077747 n=1 Tax=Rhinichthys klamathensis goyatoka TaxID=3034132 RepID=UPI0024B4CD58|nr:uncharacterized protein LOC130077747 [Rhinichthys klamathensis goyatoka]
MEDRETFRDGDVSPAFSQFHLEKSNSLEPSCVSMKSDWSMGIPPEFKGKHTPTDLSQLHRQRSNSPEPSCVSMKSDWSMGIPPEFKGKHTPTDLSQLHRQKSNSPESSCVSMKSEEVEHTPTDLRQLLPGNHNGIITQNETDFSVTDFTFNPWLSTRTSHCTRDEHFWILSRTVIWTTSTGRCLSHNQRGRLINPNASAG